MTPTFALGLPHTPWVPARVESVSRLLSSLEVLEHDDDCPCVDALDHGLCATVAPVRAGLKSLHMFTDREPCAAWSQRMYRWAIETGATHLLQLQDDVMVAPDFWPKLRAMVEAVPDQVIGLQSPHPLAPEQFRTGRRWYRDTWLLGPAWVWPIANLKTYVEWCGANPDLVEKTSEDSLACAWFAKTEQWVWHPCPSPVDHNVSVPSTYGNDEHHEFSMYRRSTVTWRDLVNSDVMNDPGYWATPLAPPVMPGPGTQVCWYCAKEPGRLVSPATGARVGVQCLANMVGTALGKL